MHLARELVSKQSDENVEQVLALPIEACNEARRNLKVQRNRKHVDKVAPDATLIQAINFWQYLERAVFGRDYTDNLCRAHGTTAVLQDPGTTLSSQQTSARDSRKSVSSPFGDRLSAFAVRQALPFLSLR